MKEYLQYSNDVLSGKITACNNVIMACKRFKNDLERDDLIFNYDKVDKAINFISILRHYTGKHNGKPFIL